MTPELLALDPGNVTRFSVRDPTTGDFAEDGALDTLAKAFKTGVETAERIDSLASALKADVTLAPAERARQLRAHALRLGESAAKTLDEARAKLTREIELVDKATSAPPPPRDPLGLQLEGEMRTAIRSMKDADRTATLSKLDDSVAAAVLRGPALLVGLSADGQAAYRARWRKAKFPVETARLARLNKASEAAERAGHALLAFVAKHSKVGAVAEAGVVRRQALEAAE